MGVYIQNLLNNDKIVESNADNLSLTLYIYGDSSPDIRKTHTYNWALKVEGNNKYSHVQEMSVEFSFNPPNENFFQIMECIPTEKTDKLADIRLNAPILSVEIPIRKDKIKFEKISPVNVKWIFKDFSLLENGSFNKTFHGILTVKFTKESREREFKIWTRITPKFCEKKLYFRREYHLDSPKINYDEVMAASEKIIPFDPENVEILGYKFIIDEGILKKGHVRNVALRAETISYFFDYLRKNQDIGKEKCKQIIKEAGKITGQNFINEFENKILKHTPTIEEWVDYDSTAGMGRFKVDEYRQYITVKNSFVAYKIKSEDEPVCHFLEGYFEGILPTLLKEKVSISEIDCIAKDDKVCKFEIIKMSEIPTLTV